jgi:hypothetical protein
MHVDLFMLYIFLGWLNIHTTHSLEGQKIQIEVTYITSF